MKRYLDLAREYFLRYARIRLADKQGLAISILTTLLATAAGFGALLILFDRPRLADWAFDEILFLYGLGLIPLSLFNVISANLYSFAETYLVGRQFDRILLRPAESLFQVLLERFRLESLADTVVGIVLALFAARRLELEFGLLGWLVLALAMLCAFLIYLAVFVTVTCLSFWIRRPEEADPTRYPAKRRSALIPFLLRWMIPFGFAVAYPSARLWHDLLQPSLLLLPVITVILVFMALGLWKRSVASYSRAG